jgi:hypothetical protein
LYYRLSPPVADFIASHDLLRTFIRELLVDPLIWMVEAAGGHRTELGKACCRLQ